MTSTNRPRFAPVAVHLYREQLVAVPVVWAFFAAGVAVFAALIATWGTVESSVWEGTAQLTRWFAGAWGVFLTAVYLPLYVAHGCTRRDFARHALPFAAAFAAVLAALMALGYALEHLAYGALGWPHELTRDHALYEVPTQYPGVLAEFWLATVAWLLVGGFVGAAFYRSGGLGILMVPVGLAGLVAVEGVLGPGFLGPLPVGEVVAGLALGPAAALYGLVVVVAAALGWTFVRDLPVRSRNA